MKGKNKTTIITGHFLFKCLKNILQLLLYQSFYKNLTIHVVGVRSMWDAFKPVALGLDPNTLTALRGWSLCLLLYKFFTISSRIGIMFACTSNGLALFLKRSVIVYAKVSRGLFLYPCFKSPNP